MNMMVSLGHPGFIQRALCATIKTRSPTTIDLQKWESFSKTFQRDTENVTLVATVLLSANVGFLAIGSVDEAGLSSWPQRFSYFSLLASLGSIVMSLAVRTPRYLVCDSKLAVNLTTWLTSY
ncbi:hypothetical protein ID866_10378 [Astraeus odoratus]|nr:hypothetical protein ID866_10378 [Astraeus odoratus]